ncbi:phosphotransferase family protein [Cellulomonas sp. PhB143]|uniref:phosphotransferase family protein n=1 Tax=Cellulomonas sp. PhB143 TaxID=2485186 RepID=UPI000F481E0B|nr:phosphotransferase family protein [Cellulomonas sp. PhB143]ROS78427.1 aminoglycoside phosphotransferase (APT) family kinase protein [Cellulomonas sp. PhB143]
MSDVRGLDETALAAWLAGACPELADGPLTARLLAGGRSNLTYRVDGGRVPLVLRRPPLGHVLATAHDMGREHRVLSALAGTAVPVPPVLDLVDDTGGTITGTPFYVMHLVEGRVLAAPGDDAGLSPSGRRALGLELAATLADLHAIDPAAVRLGDFGRPDGYLARQLTTWKRQQDASRTRDLPGLDRLQAGLVARLPGPGAGAARPTVVHGDYRLDNVLVAGSGDEPRVAAVLDWEMATLGDPLVDLGMLGLYWEISQLPGVTALVPSAVDPDAGYATFDEVVAAYAARAGTDVPDLRWYRAFASYKLAVIAEGIHHRYLQGETLGAGFDQVGAFVAPLSDDGLARLGALAP